MSVMPRALYQNPPPVAVTRFRDTPLALAVARAVLAWHYPDGGHHCRRTHVSFQIHSLGNDGQCRKCLHTPKSHQVTRQSGVFRPFYYLLNFLVESLSRSCVSSTVVRHCINTSC